MKLGSKLYLGLLVIALTVAASAAATYVSSRKESSTLADASSKFQDISSKNLALVVLTKEIEIDIIQVQQFLTDISATRGLNGLDDGAALAKEHADEFLSNVSKAEKLARDLKLPELHASLGNVRKAFEPYYQTGVKMSQAYVSGGPAAGNALMGGFDSTAKEMSKEVDSLMKITSDITAASVEKVRLGLMEGREQADTMAKVTLGTALLTLIICGGIGIFIRTAVLGPLSGIANSMLALAKGNMNTDIPLVGRSDEIGEMAGAVMVFKDNMLETEQLRSAQEEQKKSNEEGRKKAMSELASKFERRVGELVRGVAAAATELQSTAESMATTSKGVSDKAGFVASASEQTTKNAHTVAAATEELSASFTEINRRMENSMDIIRVAVSQTQDTSAKVQSLDDAARKIGEVVKLISDVADQTNLLALNATIEAARAGDAGKGFAVVAAEVKALASQTAKATEEVVGHIKAIQNAVRESTQAIDAVSHSIAKVSEISNAIAESVGEQTSATVSIAGNVAEASQGVSEIQTNIASVLQAAEDAGASAGEVLSAAGELSRNGELLAEQVDGFLAEVRAA